MGWWITLAILALLAILPLGVSALYDCDGLRVRVILGWLRITIVPLPRRMKKKNAGEKKTPKEKKTGKSREAAPDGKTEPEKKGGSLKDFLPLVKIGLNFLGDFRRKLRVNRLELKLVLAGDDPCDLAVNYGRTWAALGNLQPLLERVFIIKKRDLNVECDFTASQTLVNARLDITITLGRLLSLAAVYGIRALRAFLKMKKNKKAVQKNESETSQHA